MSHNHHVRLAAAQQHCPEPHVGGADYLTNRSEREHKWALVHGPFERNFPLPRGTGSGIDGLLHVAVELNAQSHNL